MTEQDWKRVALVLGIVVVVLLGVTGALVLAGGSGSKATPSPTPSAGIGQASTTPGSSVSPGTSAAPSAGLSSPSAGLSSPSAGLSSPSAGLSSPSAAPSPSASPSPSPSPAVPKALVRIANLQLDDPAATDATARMLVVTTDGPGSMTAKLVSASGGKVKFCLQAGTSPAFCGNYGAGVTLTGNTVKKGQTRFTITAIGASSGVAPTAAIDISFFAKAPKLEFTGLRIDPMRGPTGLDARVTIRGAGSLELQAALLDTTTSAPAVNAPWRVRMVSLDGAAFAPQDLTDTGATVQVAADVAGVGHVQATLGAQRGTSPALLASGALTWP